MSDDAPYASQWRDLGRRSVFFWLTLLASFAIGIATSQIMPATELGNAGISVVCIVLFLVNIAVSAYRGSFRCPRCSKTFFEKGIWQNSFARKCMNCRLPRGAEPEIRL